LLFKNINQNSKGLETTHHKDMPSYSKIVYKQFNFQLIKCTVLSTQVSYKLTDIAKLMIDLTILEKGLTVFFFFRAIQY